MNTTNDIDRRIAAWFDEGPARVSDSTIAHALDHARAHPRRRDPLRALRRDPMGSGWGFGTLLQPVPLLASLVLLVAVAAAGAAVGGWLDREPAVVPPVVSPSPSPSSSPVPTVVPSPETIRVDLIEHLGDDAFIDVIDTSGTLVDAVSGDPGDGVDVVPETVQVENDPADPATIILTWAGETCDTSHELVIDSDGRTLRITRPPCSGDSLGGVGHVLRLTFDGPLAAADITATIETITP